MGILQGTFDLAQCAVTIDGLPIDGFGDGDAVTIEYNAPIYNTTVGADGGYHRANSNDQGGSITFNLMQTSTVSRRLMEGILRRHELGAGGTHTINISSLRTGEQIAASQAYPEDRPTYAFGQEVTAREYMFRSPNIQRVG